MKSIKYFKEKICNFENIEKAYRNARKGRRYKKEVLAFTDKLEENLFSIKEELENMDYNGGDYYEFVIHEPKARIIMAQRFRHRVVQWAIYQVIYPEMEKGYIKDSYACIRNKGTMRAVKQLHAWVKRCNNIQEDAKRKGIEKKYFYLKLDIEKFFNTINHDISVNLHSKKTNDTVWSRYIFKTIFDPPNAKFGLPYGKDINELSKDDRLADRGMPIGNILSQENANVVLNLLDKFCKHVLKIKMYIRYMDDIAIISDSLQQIKEYARKINEFIQQELKLRLNIRKTKINTIVQGIDFCGYFVKPYRVTLRKSSCLRMKRNLKRKMREYQYGLITFEKVMQTLSSYDGILKHCDSEPLKKAIFGCVNEYGDHEGGWFVLKASTT